MLIWYKAVKKIKTDLRDKGLNKSKLKFLQCSIILKLYNCKIELHTKTPPVKPTYPTHSVLNVRPIGKLKKIEEKLQFCKT